MNELLKKIYRRICREWLDKKNLIFRLETSLNRSLIAKSNTPRPASYPYISGDTFRANAQHVFDQISSIIPTKVNTNDIVFVDIHNIHDFFKIIHPKIQSRYKLISHNGDIAVSTNLVEFIDEKVIHWFGQNVDVVHPKVSAIPIGLENMHYFNNGIIGNIKRAQGTLVLKKNKILNGFSIATNPTKRKPVNDVLKKIKLCEYLEARPNASNYLKILNTYKFVASPPGNGIDCIRTWEAMYLGVVPIVEESILTRYYAEIGLPLLLVKDWSELSKFTESYLCDLYEKISPKFANPALYFDYWINKIEEIN